MAFPRDPGLNQYKSRFYDGITPGAVDYGINPALRPTANYAPPAATGPGGSPQMMHESGHASLAEGQTTSPSSPVGSDQGGYADVAGQKSAPEKTEVQKLDDYIARQAAKLENPNITDEELALVTRKSRAAQAKARRSTKNAGTSIGDNISPQKPKSSGKTARRGSGTGQRSSQRSSGNLIP